jgi:hypothetical protein
MALRNFKDSAGNEWRVWDVLPLSAGREERRRVDRRIAPPGMYQGPERRARPDRRVRSPHLLTPGLERGWLCFEADAEKRRLTPIPTGWEGCSENELERFCGEAMRVGERNGASRSS